MKEILKVQNLEKTYQGGFKALENINLEIKEGEIFALLGPNGAGKTTLISSICGINEFQKGSVLVEGKDSRKDYRFCRDKIGLVPQELTTDAFESVWDTVRFSRGLFNKEPNDDYLEHILKKLSLWDKRKNRIMTLSGGMKRRVMIAKALSHEPRILFLDEPTAGVDVELRKDMWEQVNELRKAGVSIFLTTHYIEEAQTMADRIGIISKGKILLIEEKNKLLKSFGKKQLEIQLENDLDILPESLKDLQIELHESKLIYTFQADRASGQLCDVFDALKQENISFTDLSSKQRSLEEIFVELVSEKK